MIQEVRVQRTDQNVADGTITQVRGGPTGEAMIAHAHARYYDAVRRGNVFTASIPVTALSVNSTTFTGLALINPVGSGKAFSLLEVLVGVSTSTTTSAGLILTGGAQVTAISTNAVTVANAYMGGSGATTKAVCSSGATILTATMIRAIWDTGLATSATAPTPAPMPYIRDVVDGALLIGPGQLVSLQAITTAISAIATFTWEEVPV